MSKQRRRITAAEAHVRVEAWQNLDTNSLLEAAINGPLKGRVGVSSSFGAESAVLLDLSCAGNLGQFILKVS